MDIDFASDFDTFDGLEPVFVTPVGASTSIEVSKAWRRRINTREAALSGGAYTQRDTVITMKACSFVTPPEIGSLIRTVCDDRIWYVMEVNEIVNRTQYECMCRRGFTRNDFNMLIMIRQNVGDRDEDGAPRRKWQSIVANHPARIQEINNQVKTENNRSVLERNVQIYTEPVVDLVAGMQVVADDSQIYNISKVTTPEVGMLTVLEATLATTPGMT